MARIRVPEGRRRALAIAALVAWCLGPPALQSQELVDTLESAAGVRWNDIWFYPTGGKLFVCDETSESVLVYDANTLASLGSISVSSYAGTPQALAGHDGTGALYVLSDAGFATSVGDIVIIDADTQMVTGSLPAVGYNLTIDVDESRGRLYAFAGSVDVRLKAFEVATNTADGNLDLNTADLMPSGIIVYGGLNPATGELFFANLHEDQFVVVNGETMVGELFEVESSRGRGGTWNPIENKLLITTINWGGYFVFDRDTDTSALTSCVNDGTLLFFSAATNRVYSGAEVNGDTTVIDGPTNACENVEVGVGRAAVGFVAATSHAYFLGSSGTSVLDETTLTEVASFPGCGYCEGGGVVDHEIAVDQQGQRLFARSWCDTTFGVGSCIQVLEEDDLFLDGFEGGDTSAGSATVPP
jgi:hypothetical protein